MDVKENLANYNSYKKKFIYIFHIIIIIVRHNQIAFGDQNLKLKPSINFYVITKLFLNYAFNYT